MFVAVFTNSLTRTQWIENTCTMFVAILTNSLKIENIFSLPLLPLLYPTPQTLNKVFCKLLFLYPAPQTLNKVFCKNFSLYFSCTHTLQLPPSSLPWTNSYLFLPSSTLAQTPIILNFILPSNFFFLYSYSSLSTYI
jgi:hypothetical protein